MNKDIGSKALKITLDKRSKELRRLAVKALEIMNNKKITTLLVASDNDYEKSNDQFKIKGILHIHSLLTKGIK